MESYHKRKKLLEEKYGKLIILKPFNDDNGDVRGAFSTPTERGTAPFVIADNKQQKIVKQLQDITDEEGLKRAYDTKDGLYQHYNKPFIAGTKDFPVDHIDDLKLPSDDTLNNTTIIKTANKHYSSHHEIDTAIGHSLGGAIALPLEKQYKKEGDNPYGIVQSKTFGSPTVSGNIRSPLLKNIVKAK